MSKKEKFAMQIGDQVFSKGNDIGKFLVGIMHPKIYSTPIEQKYYPFLEAFIKQHPDVAEKTKDAIMDCCFVTSHRPFYPFTHSAKTTMHFYTKGGEIVTLSDNDIGYCLGYLCTEFKERKAVLQSQQNINEEAVTS